jgi:hypothetical protein
VKKIEQPGVYSGTGVLDAIWRKACLLLKAMTVSVAQGISGVKL